MSPLILLALITGVPLAAFTLLRVKPLYLFTSVMAGYLWMTFLGEPAELVVHSLLDFAHPDVIARLLLLAIPIVLTLIIMRGSLSTSALPFQFFLLVANSLLVAVLILNALSGGMQDSLRATNPGKILSQSSDVLIAGVAGLHMLVMWIMRPRSHDGGHGRHKKKRH